MRVIKFRAWDKANRVMVIASSKKMLVIDTTNSLSDSALIDDYELMQFTGLTDKNGKDIYEGDVIKWKDFFIGSVYFDSGRYLINTSNANQDLLTYIDRYLEIIGNIHENPELLCAKKLKG